MNRSSYMCSHSTAARPRSERSAELLADALVWDMTLPWSAGGQAELLLDWKAAGFDFVSVSIAGRGHGAQVSMQRIGDLIGQLRQHGEQVTLVTSVEGILAAKHEGKLGVGVHFQETWPFEHGTELV